MDIPDELRCRGITVEGKRCKRPSRRGDSFCEKHLSMRPTVDLPAVKATASPEKVKAEVVQVARAAGIEVADPNHAEPVEVMDWCVSQAHFICDKFMEVLRASPDITADKMAPTVRSTLEAIGHARKSAEAAESAGMQRRRVVVEEAKARLVFLCIDRAIDRMGFEPEVAALFRERLGDELHTASAGAAA